jgi:predicted GIY-YIG superfamily endonuclease
MTKPSKEIKQARKEKLLEPSNQTLYRFFNANNELLYVGITNNPFNRFSGHSKDKEWFKEITHSTMEHYPNRLAVDRAETMAIKSEKPKYNRAKVDGFEKAQDHFKKIRYGRIDNHDMLMGIVITNSANCKFLNLSVARDAYYIVNAIKHAKTLGHKCSACDSILKDKRYVQYSEQLSPFNKK